MSSKRIGQIAAVLMALGFTIILGVGVVTLGPLQAAGYVIPVAVKIGLIAASGVGILFVITAAVIFLVVRSPEFRRHSSHSSHSSRPRRAHRSDTVHVVNEDLREIDEKAFAEAMKARRAA